jgi:branched-chain amino acid transport system ATP-binding protein
MSTAVLETRGLSKSFGALTVAEHVDFSLQPGARHALIGPNGAGKTTFVNLVTGRISPSAGTVFLDGQDVTRLPQNARVKLGLVRTFQINTLFLGLSVLDNVALALAEREGIAWNLFRPLGHSRMVLEEGRALLDTLGLGQHAARLVRELSYGRQRLVEIALGLALRPRVLLLDEPAAGVPSGESAVVIDTLQRLPGDISILMIEHDMDLVFRFAERITVLNQGRILALGTPAEIASNERVRAVYFGEREIAHA